MQNIQIPNTKRNPHKNSINGDKIFLRIADLRALVLSRNEKMKKLLN